MYERSLNVKNISEHGVFHPDTMDSNVQNALSPDGVSGIFITRNVITIKTEDTAIVIGDGEVHVDARLTQKEMTENKGRGLVTNPLGILPGLIVPPLIPSSINYLPDLLLLLPFINIGVKTMQVVAALATLEG